MPLTEIKINFNTQYQPGSVKTGTFVHSRWECKLVQSFLDWNLARSKVNF